MAFELVRETKIANVAKLANMLIDLFGIPEAFENYVKPDRVGQEIEMEFPALENSVTFALVNKKTDYDARFGKPSNPVATIVLNVKREKVAITLGKLIRKKSNLMGVLSLAPLILTRKIVIKGSFFAAITLCRIMMIGKNPVYKDK